VIQIPEYDPSNTDSLTVLREQDIISKTEAESFRQELVRIAGTTSDGQARLKMVWGPTHIDPMSEDQTQLKYLDFSHNGQQLGERRFFIEIHRSPEFLVKSGRYKVLNAPDQLEEFYLCKGCEADLGKIEPIACPKCGSKRNALRQIRAIDGHKLLMDFPRQGCYDYWFRLERKNFTYHPPDGETLEFIRALWEWEMNNQRDALKQADSEMKRRKAIAEARQRTKTRVHFGASPLII
jgi:hypothetical protein